MRFIAPLLFSSFVSLTALADANVATVDDEPTSRDATRATATTRTANRHAPADTGELRAARIDAPAPVAVDDRSPVAREHDVAPPQPVSAATPDGDVVAELAAKQMKRHQRALDGCVAAAHKRAPTATGMLTLDFDVADRKVKSVHVSDDAVHDLELARCLTATARTFTFSLAAARFRWPIALQP